MKTNIFKIIIGTEKEDYHDRVLEWLGHPRESHGLGSAFFHAMVKRFFGVITDEPVLRVKREYPLSKTDWADLFLESASYAITIDDKVSLSAIHNEKVVNRHVQREFERELLDQYVEYIAERLAVPEGTIAPPGKRAVREGNWTTGAFFNAVRRSGGPEAEDFHRRLYETARKARFGTMVFGRGKNPSWLLKIGRGQRQVSLLGAQANGQVWMDFAGWGTGLRERARALFRRNGGAEIGQEANWTFLDPDDRAFLLNLESLLHESQQLV